MLLMIRSLFRIRDKNREEKINYENDLKSAIIERTDYLDSYRSAYAKQSRRSKHESSGPSID